MNAFIEVRRLLALLLIPCIAGPGQPLKKVGGQSDLIWIEGEAATRSQVYRNAWFDAVDPDQLSGGAQIGSFSEPKHPGGWAEFDFNVPAEATYHLWLRANLGSGFAFRVEGLPWQSLDSDLLDKWDNANRNQADFVAKRQQQVNDAADGTADARYMTWFQPADFQLSAGKHTLRVNLGGDNDAKARFAALDCLVLTPGSFKPNYQYKPGESPTGVLTAEPGSTWPFQPPRDPLTPNAMLDLRYLNERVAGEHGFIRAGKDGDFLRGDGQPTRFWGGSDYVQRIAHDENSQTVLEHHAQFLAKRGVNVVRLHGAIEPKGEDSNLTDVDESELDQMYRLVAGMKKAGIYTMIDPYWAVQAHAKPKWGIPDAGDGNLTGLIFFDKTLQRGYKAWLKRIYADVNPYTGIPLAKDPSIAAIQLQNEDGLLFWTSQSIKGPALAELEGLYAQFLTHKYGSVAKAADHWQHYPVDGDDFEHGHAALPIVWELTQDARNKKGSAPGREARLADQTEFIAKTMADFNAEMVRYLKVDLGCRQLVLPGNWRTADQVILDDAERWSYLPGDIEGKNEYFNGIHNGLNTGWQILPGQVYTSRSWTKDPVNSPLGIRQTVGRPFMIPETLWVPPNLYDSEAAIIASGQSSLTGLGPLFWFADGVEEWERPINIWTFALPTSLGQWPAAALAYREGYIEQSRPVVHEERSDADVFGRKMPMIAEEGAWDPNRDTVQLPQGSSYKAEIDPLAFLVGRVEVKYHGDPKKSYAVNLAPFVDRTRNIVRSATGQISTDIAHGLYEIDAPKIQAVAGFLNQGGAHTLTDVLVDAKNDYGSIAVVSLDGMPLAKSGKVLVQIGTESRPTGWKERALTISVAGKPVSARRILDTGRGPWQIVKASGGVRLRNSSVARATVLDPNGLEVRDLPLTRQGAWVTFTLPPDALYVVLDRK